MSMLHFKSEFNALMPIFKNFIFIKKLRRLHVAGETSRAEAFIG
jgi:hypothetical protein